jgi:hypothetical protein
MILNDALLKHAVFTQITLKDNDKELSKELKVKIMRIRMMYNKIKNKFDSDIKEFMSELITDDLRDLATKQDRTPEEEKLFLEVSEKLDKEHNEFIKQKILEEVSVQDDSLSQNEYEEIVDINSGNKVVINGNSISAEDFLELVYDLFVKE